MHYSSPLTLVTLWGIVWHSGWIIKNWHFILTKGDMCECVCAYACGSIVSWKQLTCWHTECVCSWRKDITVSRDTPASVSRLISEHTVSACSFPKVQMCRGVPVLTLRLEANHVCWHEIMTFAYLGDWMVPWLRWGCHCNVAIGYHVMLNYFQWQWIWSPSQEHW